MARCWFAGGSWVVHWWFMPGSWLVHSWFVWFMPGSWVVRGWFMAGSRLVPRWFVDGSCVVRCGLLVHRWFRRGYGPWRKPRQPRVKPADSLRPRAIRAIAPWHPWLRSLSVSLRQVFEAWSPIVSTGWGDDPFQISCQVAYTLRGRPLFSLCRRP